MVKKIEVNEDIPDAVKDLIDRIRNNDEVMSALKDYIEVNQDE